MDRTKRVYNEGGPYAILAEHPVLLDPTEADDPQLLTFSTDGTAQPACKAEDRQEDYQRAHVSIQFYHLNHTDLKERRQVCICNKIEWLVDNGNMYRSFIEQNRLDIAAIQGYKQVVKGIREMIHESAEYSASARAILKIYRNWPWVDALLAAS